MSTSQPDLSVAQAAAATATEVTTNRAGTPDAPEFRAFIASGWAEPTATRPTPHPASGHASQRRARLMAAFPDTTIVVPAGGPKQRANDTDYPYRAHSAFSWLTGWGSDTVPDSVLVLGGGDPAAARATLYLRAPAGRDTDEFYANAAIGEFWTGPRPSLALVADELGLPTADLSELDAAIGSVDGHILVLREADPARTFRVDAIRAQHPAPPPGDQPPTADASTDADLARWLSEARLVKDEYEIAELRAAIAATKHGFDDLLAALPRATARTRGERVLEGAFAARARLEGNDVGYGSIAAAGAHATILHWTRNDGPVQAGDLVLVDAGIERDSYYTADITRTFPVTGTFTPLQRAVYEAVREAADAAFAVVRPGVRFSAVHAAAMETIAARTADWGFLPVPAAESIASGIHYHRRYMVHGTSHHLGLDVHDCAQARRECYREGLLQIGMVFTIEPGLYFQPDDLTVPPEFRGIGVRIEDNILVTADGAENLSIAIPRTADAVEAWVRKQRAGRG